MRTIALRRIEGKRMGSRFLQGNSAIRADQMLGIMVYASAFHVHNRHRALSESQGRSHRFSYPLFILGLGFEAVHHKVYEMHLVSVEGFNFSEFHDFLIYASVGVALASELGQEFAVVPLTASHQRSEQKAFAVCKVADNQGYNLFVGVAHHLLARHRGIGF